MEFFIVRNMIVKRNKKWDGIPLTFLKTGRSLYSMALLIFVMKSILEKSPFPQWAESIPPSSGTWLLFLDVLQGENVGRIEITKIEMTTIWKGRGTRSAISITGRAVVLRKGVIDMEKRRNVEQHSDHLTTEKYTEVLVFFMGRKQESCFFKEPFPVYVTSPYFRPRIIAEFSLSKLCFCTKNMLVLVI